MFTVPNGSLGIICFVHAEMSTDGCSVGLVASWFLQPALQPTQRHRKGPGTETSEDWVGRGAVGTASTGWKRVQCAKGLEENLIYRSH